MFVAFGNKDAGSLQAQRIAGLLKSKFGTAKGTVQLVTGDLGSTVAQERRDGVLEGLKKLTVSNLGNLTPHPMTVWLSHSHPPVLQRIKALEEK